MRPLRFLHAADLHLDSPFKGHVEHAGEFSEAIRESTFATFARLVDIAIAERVDFALFAGDLYDARDRSLKAQLVLRDGLARLSDAGIRSFLVHGNHDPLSGRAAQIAMPPLAHAFDGMPATVEVKREWETIATVTGVSYARAEVTENLAKGFPDPGDSPFAIALLHANLGGNREHAGYAPCALEDLAAKRFRYWALGHVHAQQVLRATGAAGDFVAAYPGNPQGRSVRETGARGALLVEVDESGRISPRPIVADDVRWYAPRVAVDGCASVDALEERIAEEIRLQTAPAGHEPAGHVFRITLSGRGALHPTLSRAGDLGELARALRRRFLSESTPRRFVLLESLVDVTGRQTDRAALAREASLLGDALRLAEELKDAASPDRAKLAEALEPLRRRLRGVIEVGDESELAAILERASELAIDLLDEDAA